MTTNELKAGFAALQALAEAVRELKQVPSGILYSRVMNYLDINAYESAIRTLCNAGVIRKSGDLLHWNV
jgi:hypothetical protein